MTAIGPAPYHHQLNQSEVNNFILAAGNGNQAAVVRFLKEYGLAINRKNDTAGRTALMWASRMGRTDVVRLLLDRGAAIDEKDNEGKTALMLAAWNGHKDTVELLLERHAALDKKDNRGWTALMLAQKWGQTKTAGVLYMADFSPALKHSIPRPRPFKLSPPKP